MTTTNEPESSPDDYTAPPFKSVTRYKMVRDIAFDALHRAEAGRDAAAEQEAQAGVQYKDEPERDAAVDLREIKNIIANECATIEDQLWLEEIAEHWLRRAQALADEREKDHAALRGLVEACFHVPMVHIAGCESETFGEPCDCHVKPISDALRTAKERLGTR